VDQTKVKVSLDDIRELMANHYEGTALDSRKYVAAGIFEAPYRPSPLSWHYKGQQYVNERAVATASTGWNFIAQIRPFMPVELSTVLWFGVDDSSTSPRFPVYSSSKALSNAFHGSGEQDGVREPLLAFDLTKAFWVQNMVSNFVYFRYKDAYPVLKNELDTVHKNFTVKLQQVDEEALNLFQKGFVDEALVKVTEFGVQAGDSIHEHWLRFYGELFVQFRDYVTFEKRGKNSGSKWRINRVGYDEEWKGRIVLESGDHYKLYSNDSAVESEKGNSVLPLSRDIYLFLFLQCLVCITAIIYASIGSLRYWSSRRSYDTTSAELTQNFVLRESESGNRHANSERWSHKKGQAFFDYGSLLSPRSTIITHNT
jgi:hypothetical protein